jgi:predicted GNAT superfamily acetyltransferase
MTNGLWSISNSNSEARGIAPHTSVDGAPGVGTWREPVAAVQSIASRWDTVGSAARAAADAAARRADVDLRAVDTLWEITAVADLLAGIWERPGEPPMPAELLRALTHSGNYVVAAHQNERIVGALVGFLGRHDEIAHLHSHILGVRDDARVGGVGFALKQHQRAWALERGLDTIDWTFDPLVRGNAFFNIAKLGAMGHAYSVNFYGEMPDVINKGDESDRVVVRWKLTDPKVDRAARGVPMLPDIDALRASGAAVALTVADGGTPRRGASGGDLVLAQIPSDIVELRRHDAPAAAEWRCALREVMTEGFANGLRVTAMSREGWYVLSAAGG